ncbi:tRNA (adenosine(37)-N6)-threonylcarbamoyltransferase complex transferase subunit TsaD [Candidatus Parcubacteria bacterium]|nr:tRNA (adenosine(37)-N6)-threonylcarbamoyltransferase complex transferase subunit TsaD [Candidatus Parcubacteria bacterium]
MKILGIETSCDETALCVTEGFSVLGTSLFSQVKIHEKYGGVFPMLAKREHAKNLILLFKDLIEKIDTTKQTKSASKTETTKNQPAVSAVRAVFTDEQKYFTDIQKEFLEKMLEREPELLVAFLEYIPTIEKPDIDAIAVTYGPGLEPALWVGINFAKALGYIWGLPIIPINHMEGHIVSVLASTQVTETEKNNSVACTEITFPAITFPALALLISGGHTELVHILDWTKYEVIGQTRDDAVGEAFDKVARMLSLPYPGGPHIGELAEKERKERAEQKRSGGGDGEKTGDESEKNPFIFPRPMIHSNDFDFSFSGLKTSVLYKIKELGELTPKIKQQIACAFEDAVVEVLLEKTKKAIIKYGAKSLIVGGGVIANTKIRESFLGLEKITKEEESPSERGLKVFIPDLALATDNAVMIAMAGYIQATKNPSVLKTDPKTIVAQGNLRL